MELELKHLAPYLPYGFLYGIYENQKVIIRGMNYNSDYLNIDFEINNHNKVSSTCFFNEIKPILRPLSDLTKEIEVNGNKFIPAEILFSVENDELQDFKDFGKIPEYWQDAVKIKPKFYDYYQVEFLFEWHFDVFGLIEKGLAIDINTLPQSSE